MAMLNKIRGLVSKKKVRYQEDGFDLDLTYITEEIIAMGFPAEEISGLYRNPISEVQRFFKEKHPDTFKVYNLCSERTYDPAKFKDSVSRYPFDDHNCPSISLMLAFCEDVHKFITADSANVAAIHCKAGKGRTGVMIASYLLFDGSFETPEEALAHFGNVRTSNGKGVTIPSQKRFISYFHSFLLHYHQPKIYFDFLGKPLVLKRVRLHTAPSFDSDGGCDPYFLLHSAPPQRKLVADTRKSLQVKHFYKKDPYFDLVGRWPVRGDIKMSFMDEDKLSSDDSMCHFWFHTSFIHGLYLELTKEVVDKARKDKKQKHFDNKFRIECWFENDVDPDDGPTSGDTTEEKEDFVGKSDDACQCGLSIALTHERIMVQKLAKELQSRREEVNQLRQELGHPAIDETNLLKINHILDKNITITPAPVKRNSSKLTVIKYSKAKRGSSKNEPKREGLAPRNLDFFSNGNTPERDPTPLHEKYPPPPPLDINSEQSDEYFSDPGSPGEYVSWLHDTPKRRAPIQEAISPGSGRSLLQSPANVRVPGDMSQSSPSTNSAGSYGSAGGMASPGPRFIPSSGPPSEPPPPPDMPAPSLPAQSRQAYQGFQAVQQPHPNDQRYNQQWQGHSPQGQGYSPQGQGYSPQGQGYSQQGQGYSPRGQGYDQQSYEPDKQQSTDQHAPPPPPPDGYNGRFRQ